MENSPGTASLLCDENVFALDEEETDEFGSMFNVNDDEDEYIESLVRKEIVSNSVETRLFLKRWGGGEGDLVIRGARMDGVDYILQKREELGLEFRTACLSITYLDRFCSRRSIDAQLSWQMQLLSLACLTLAAKMEEISVPQLSQFCVEDYDFDNSLIRRMELFVLLNLEWKMGSVTPFAYTHYFLKKMRNKDDKVPIKKELVRIEEVLLDATKDLKIMSYRPSVIAAAATLVVLDQGLNRTALELNFKPLASTLALEIEDLVSCYNQLEQMISGIKSPDLSPSQLQRSGAGFGNSTTSVGSSKRRRLNFDQDDEKKRKHLSFR